ncbi:DUF1150 family protein [Paracoccus marinaquae]|uniref:DUF1150 domain-containing protein n=1 Tax=Paracoccus marinaquae TaxID=2841926 RepID=A0ABS6ADS6_9RHOB|nr:DUF1150 family protein [Paracoccus marinaquae]MBU3028748.1 DUF1150 domain-containing protein [Paracoccus marinaquae]
MDTKFDFGEAETQKIVYVRRVATSTLPQEIRAQVPGVDALYAVHDAEGERLALVQDRSLAFVLARQHEFSPVSVH